jgi:hypothetical protein
MDSDTDARRHAGRELQMLADEFERSDEAAFRRTRIACWIIFGIVSLVILVLLMAGADWRYLGTFWVGIVGLAWGAYALSRRRQRQQTGQLRELANRWLAGSPSRAS